MNLAHPLMDRRVPVLHQKAWSFVYLRRVALHALPHAISAPPRFKPHIGARTRR